MKFRKTINEIEREYDLEINKVISKIKKLNSKVVLLQFPDGLKPYATEIVDCLEEKLENKVDFLIWLGSCFGACDLPIEFENLGPKIDLAVQFGHNEMMPKY